MSNRQTCLEMVRDVVTSNNNPDDPRARSESRPKLAGRPGLTIGEGK
jgi:hypothetical protein